MNKLESYPAAAEFKKQVETSFPGNKPHFICGVSGGVDSMSLLYLVHRFGMSATVVHINYGMRGKESDKDQDFTEQMANMWGFDCVSARFKPEERDQNNFQAWARDVRYRAFRDLMEESGAEFILTAHHQDDQVETILQKILRGAGLSRWKGMEVIDGDLFRPLLNLSKTEIMEFAKEFEVPFREDESNLEAEYARNLIRLKLAPELDDFFPGWRDNILKIPQRAEESDQMAGEILRIVKDDEGVLNRKKFLELAPGIRSVILTEFIRQNAPAGRVSSGITDIAGSLEKLESGGELSLPEGFTLIRDRDQLVLKKPATDLDDQPVKIASPELLPLQLEQFTISIDKWDGKINSKELVFDLDALQFPALIRRWRDGDRITPLGMKGSKLLSDLLTDHKVSSVQKRSAKVVESFDGNLCAVIFPHITENGLPGVIADPARCKEDTEQVFKLSNIT